MSLTTSTTTGPPAERRQLAGAGRVAAAAAVIGLLGLAAGTALGPVHGWEAFFRSYLLNYAYVLSLALGALFFVMLQHLVRAGWSVALRRLAELVAGTLPLLAVLFLPLLVPVLTGMAGLYEWSDPGHVARDALLQHKRPYLNPPFFLVRCGLYFVTWLLLARLFTRLSSAQDASGDVRLTLRMQWWSGPGLLLYGLTVTFFAIDALMSLSPHWYSTIWGVYFFSGAVVGFLALLIVLVAAVQRAGALRVSVTAEQYHDLGKLLFGFVVFWAYIAFSQYLLIWYANLPEETVWYAVRQAGPGWAAVSLALLCGHFFLPLLALMSRYPKRRPGLLAAAAIWLLAMHWLDLYIIVAPRPGAPAAGPPPLHLTDLALLAGLGGLLVAAIVRPMARRTLLPERDPRLAEAQTYRNV